LERVELLVLMVITPYFQPLLPVLVVRAVMQTLALAPMGVRAEVAREAPEQVERLQLIKDLMVEQRAEELVQVVAALVKLVRQSAQP
jgi:hypothetical protein